MSDETSSAPETTGERAPAPAAPRVRRISNPRPKKQKSADASAEPVKAADPVPAAPVESAPANDWPEPETVSDPSSESGDAKRNKRRRRKGKGNKNGPREISDTPVGGEDSPPLPVLVEPSEGAASPAAAEVSPPAPAASVQKPQHNPQHQQPRPQQQPQRTPIDPEVLAKRAWKIYLAEISEEGVSLINDQDARELSRRCFRLAEIFLDEQGRRAR